MQRWYKIRQEVFIILKLDKKLEWNTICVESVVEAATAGTEQSKSTNNNVLGNT